MKRIFLVVLLVAIALVGCKRKEQVTVAPLPAVVNVAPPAVNVPAAPTAPAVEAAKPAPTPGTFADKKPSTPKEEKPGSFAKKVANPKPASSDAPAAKGAEDGGKKSFAAKKKK